MRITIEKLRELGACVGGIDMFPRFPGLAADGSADVRELCLWACMEGCENYSCWLLPRLMVPTGAVEWAIRCAKLVCRDDAWLAWAERWLSGDDRSKEAAARAAARAAELVALWSADEAGADPTSVVDIAMEIIEREQGVR